MAAQGISPDDVVETMLRSAIDDYEASTGDSPNVAIHFGERGITGHLKVLPE